MRSEQLRNWQASERGGHDETDGARFRAPDDCRSDIANFPCLVLYHHSVAIASPGCTSPGAIPPSGITNPAAKAPRENAMTTARRPNHRFLLSGLRGKSFLKSDNFSQAHGPQKKQQRIHSQTKRCCLSHPICICQTSCKVFPRLFLHERLA